MILYQAIDSADIIKEFFNKTNIKMNVLISYIYLVGNAVKVTETYRNMIGNICLDSGAFSVFTKKVNISVTEYLMYLKLYGDEFDTVFTLDDRFDDPEHNLRNQMFLEEGLRDKTWKPVPCIHDTVDPLGEIKTYIDQGHDYIALGSLGANKKISTDVMDQIKEKYPDIRFHLFGSLNREVLYKYRPYSADASSWAAEAGLGFIFYWDPIDEKEYEIDLQSRVKRSSTKKAAAGKKVAYSDFHHKAQLNEFLHNTFDYDYVSLLNTSIPRQIVNLYFITQLEGLINSTP